MRRTPIVLIACAIAVTGCGDITPDKIDEPVEVSGTVALPSGKPAKNVTLRLLPTGLQRPANMDVGDDGKFTGRAVPGEYTYVFEEPAAGTGKTKAKSGLADVPQKYTIANQEHKVTVSSGGALDIKLQ